VRGKVTRIFNLDNMRKLTASLLVALPIERTLVLTV